MTDSNSIVYKPTVYDNYLYFDPDSKNQILVGSIQWIHWLNKESTKEFHYEDCRLGNVNIRKELHESGKYFYWKAYKKIKGRTFKSYVGKTEKATINKLLEVCEKIYCKSIAINSKESYPTRFNNNDGKKPDSDNSVASDEIENKEYEERIEMYMRNIHVYTGKPKE